MPDPMGSGWVMKGQAAGQILPDLSNVNRTVCLIPDQAAPDQSPDALIMPDPAHWVR
jgi:hypothetical protein